MRTVTSWPGPHTTQATSIYENMLRRTSQCAAPIPVSFESINMSRACAPTRLAELSCVVGLDPVFSGCYSQTISDFPP